MPSDIILRGEDALPDDLAALLREPPPEGVWHIPGHPPEPEKHGFVRRVVGALRAVTGRARAETMAFDDDEREDDDNRFGLWLTPEHLLLADDRGPRAVRREDIGGFSVRPVRRLGQRRSDLLAFELRQGRLYYPVEWLYDWAGQADKLRAELDRRLKKEPSRVGDLEDFAASRQFDGFVRWLDTEVRRLQPDTVSRSRLLELSAVALSSWPDETRRALPDWFLSKDVDASGRRDFARDKASWLLPLCRTVSLQATSHFPDADSVADCALTFRDVPLTRIEIDGSLDDRRFGALLAWAGTKPLKMLAIPGVTESQRARLAHFKREHRVA
ncbi:MAG: hypothetical protein KIS73_06635 [Enhydrobacter sp.]|nr:hypothetical protein [Enhydrobacter sp.]